MQGRNRQIHLKMFCYVVFFCSALLSVHAQNLLVNGDFDNGSTGWSTQTWGNVQFTSAPDAGRTSTGTVITTTAEYNDCYWYQNVVLETGKEYILKGYIRGSSVTGGYGASLGYAGSTVSAQTAGQLGNFDWKYVYTTFTADSGGDVHLRLGNWGQESIGQVMYDDIRLEEVQHLLIIVAKPLWNQDLADALQLYQADITAQGWDSEVKTVSNNAGLSPDWVCTSPASLKAYITDYYEDGYDGVLFVGSSPDIPTAFFHYQENEGENGPTDLYYVTINKTWVDNNSDGIYEHVNSYGTELNEDSDYVPDMIFGRISASKIKEDTGTTDIEKERILILNYFSRIHTYRTSGSSLTDEMQDRALIFRDDDWSGKNTNHNEDCLLKYHQLASRDITVYLDTELTNNYDFHNLLGEGFRFADIGHHAGEFADWLTNENGDFIGQNYAHAYTMEEQESLAPDALKANYLNLWVCGEGRYAESRYPLPAESSKYSAGTYLFRSSNLLNVTADSISGSSIEGGSFFIKLNEERTIGEAMKAEHGEWQARDIIPANNLLFGDPLIIYPRKILANNRGPKIYNDLRNLEAKQGETFTYEFDIVDPEDDPVTLYFYNLPEHAYPSGERTLEWVVADDQVGKNYTITAEAMDTYGNSYLEKFTIYASYFEKGSMTYEPGKSLTGWTPSSPSLMQVGYGMDSPLRETLWALTTDNSYGYIYQTVTVTPDTDYKLVYFTINDLTQNPGQVHMLIQELGLNITDINKTEYCSQEYSFSSGDNSSLTFYLFSGSAGAPTTGKIAFAGLKLVELGPTTDPFAGQSTVYLSDINPEYAFCDYSFVHRDEDVDFNPLHYNGVDYDKGLGVQAESIVRYRLDQKCSLFIVDIPNDGKQQYEVYADGAQIYGPTYPPTGEAPVHEEFDVTGVQKITLKIVELAPYDVACYWLDAKVTVAPVLPDIDILYKNNETNLTTGTLRPWFQVKNNSGSAINLEDVKIRYWYTKDSSETQHFVCDYAQVGAANVTGNFIDITPVTGADNYLELGFTSGAGTLNPGAYSGEIQNRLYKTGWVNYSQSNDYSFERYMTTYGNNTRVTAYYNGELVFGVEP